MTRERSGSESKVKGERKESEKRAKGERKQSERRAEGERRESSAGAVLDYTLTLHSKSGDRLLEIVLGVDACAHIGPVQECGGDLTSLLPLDFLDVRTALLNTCSHTAAAPQ